MKLLCPALLSGSFLPARCMHPSVTGGQNISPPLLWSELPSGAASFVLCVTDLDAPAPDYVLWFLSNIPATLRALPENASANRLLLPAGCLEHRNAAGELRYTGPRVPRGGTEHRIEFSFWALEIPRLKAGPYTAHVVRRAALEHAAMASASFVVTATRTT